MKKISIIALLSFLLFSCKNDNKEIDNNVDWIDPVFAKVLEERGYIRDRENVTKSEVAKLEVVNVEGTSDSKGPIQSLRGIEYFTSLTKFNANFNYIKEADLNSNLNLREFHAEFNEISNLNVERCKNLEDLRFQYNNVSGINLKNNSELVHLEISHNPISELDLSANSKLVNLMAYDNLLSDLDVSPCPLLSTLRVPGNKLTSLNLSNNPNLVTLECNSNLLPSIDISHNLSLVNFICDSNPGINGVFSVKAWFNSTAVPENFTKEPWTYNGSQVEIDYYQ